MGMVGERLVLPHVEDVIACQTDGRASFGFGRHTEASFSCQQMGT